MSGHPNKILDILQEYFCFKVKKRVRTIQFDNRQSSLIEVFTGTKFGAASPQAVRKMLALSDPHKTRPYQPKHCPPPLPVPGLAIHTSGLEPSPGAPRRVGSGNRVPMHERSHSDTPSGLPPPVDLSAESSSVTSLSNLQPLRKTLTSGKFSSIFWGFKRNAEMPIFFEYFEILYTSEFGLLSRIECDWRITWET